MELNIAELEKLIQEKISNERARILSTIRDPETNPEDVVLLLQDYQKIESQIKNSVTKKMIVEFDGAQFEIKLEPRHLKQKGTYSSKPTSFETGTLIYTEYDNKTSGIFEVLESGLIKSVTGEIDSPSHFRNQFIWGINPKLNGKNQSAGFRGWKKP